MNKKLFKVGGGLVAAAAIFLAGINVASGYSNPKTVVVGKGSTLTKIARSNNSYEDNSPGGTWKTVPAMNTTIAVPAGGKGIILARFNSEFLCEGTDYASIRIRVGTTIMEPEEDLDNAAMECDGNYQTTTVERSSNVLSPGTYTVSVQYNNSGSYMWIDDMHFVVQRLDAS